MSRTSHNDNRPVFTSLSKASFGVAGLAFLGSFASAAINHSLSGWMAVAGMAGLGLFYLALGVLNLGHAPKSLFDRDANTSVPASHSRSRGKASESLDSELEAQPDELVEV